MSWINEFLTSAWTLRDRSNAGILFGVRTQAKREAALFPQQMKISVALSFAGALQNGLSNGVGTGFVGADADALLQRHDENFAVADFPALGRFDNRLDSQVDEIVVHGDFQPHLFDQVDGTNLSAVVLRKASLLAAAALTG